MSDNDPQRTTTLPPLRSIAGVGTLLSNQPQPTQDDVPKEPGLHRPTIERIASLGLSPNELRARDGTLADWYEHANVPRSRPAVASACLNCRKSHLACDVGRPCRRCVMTGKPETCVDAQHRKRGRPKLHETATGKSKAKPPHANNNNNVTPSSNLAQPIANQPFTIIISMSQRIARISPDGAAALGYVPNEMHEKLLAEFVVESDVQRLSHLFNSLRNTHENIQFGGPVPCSLEEMFSHDMIQLSCMVPDTLAPSDTIRFNVKNTAQTDIFKVTMWLGGYFGANLKEPETLKKAYFVASLRPMIAEVKPFIKSESLSLQPLLHSVPALPYSTAGLSAPSNYVSTTSNVPGPSHFQHQGMRYLTHPQYPSLHPIMPNENPVHVAVQTTSQDFSGLGTSDFLRRQSLPVLPSHSHSLMRTASIPSLSPSMASISEDANLQLAMRRNSLDDRAAGNDVYGQPYRLGVGVGVQAYPNNRLHALSMTPVGHIGDQSGNLAHNNHPAPNRFS